MLNKIFGKKTYQNLFIAIFFIIPLLLFKYNFNKTDLHNIWVGDNLAYDIINTLPKNSLLVLVSDTALFNTWYIHFGLKVRPDVHFISLVGNNSLRKLTDGYLKKFPKDAKDPDLIAKTLFNLSSKTSVFSNFQIQSPKGKKIIWVPYGLTYKLENDKDKTLPEDEFIKTESKIWNAFKNKNIEKIDNLSVNSLTISEIALAYSNAMIAQGGYIFNTYNDSKLALPYLQKGIDLDKNNSNAYLALAAFQMSNLDCNKALDNLKKAIAIDTLNNKAYYFLYIDYKLCLKNNKKSEDVAKKYKIIFKGDFFKDFKESDIKIKI